ncbi:hypothetical protein PHSC3_000388 [Chlamydiales bacterium STE3]|nr:hypothetical protein PHSC3_000388 [Chlamydiales bacterium STE3]
MSIRLCKILQIFFWGAKLAQKNLEYKKERKKALKYIEKGGRWNAASKIFDVTTRPLANWLRKKKNQDLAPKSRRPSPSKINSGKLKKYIQQYPDAYLREIAQEFNSTL